MVNRVGIENEIELATRIGTQVLMIASISVSIFFGSTRFFNKKTKTTTLFGNQKKTILFFVEKMLTLFFFQELVLKTGDNLKINEVLNTTSFTHWGDAVRCMYSKQTSSLAQDLED